MPTERLAAHLRRLGLFAQVEACFLKEPPYLAAAVAAVGAARVYVVPNFAGAGVITREIVPREMGLVGRRTVRGAQVILYAEPVGSHPRIPALLLARAEAMATAAGIDPIRSALLLVAHGSSAPGGSGGTALAIAAALRRRRRFGEVATVFLEQAPFLADWPAQVTAGTVIVAPLLVAEGLHRSRDVPPAFGVAPGAAGPGLAHGRRTWLCPGIGSDEDIVEIILDRVRDCDAG